MRFFSISETADLLVCIHEAGHAAAAAVLELPLKEVYVTQRDRRRLGYSQLKSRGMSWRNYGIYVAAGPEAEEVIGGAPPGSAWWTSAPVSDRTILDNILRHIQHRVGPGTTETEIVAAARQLLTAHRTAVLGVAAALERSHALGGLEVRSIVLACSREQAAIPLPANDLWRDLARLRLQLAEVG
jgi:hypothetical protein